MDKRKIRRCLGAALSVFVAAETFCFAWTDDPIVAGQTPIRAVHFTELRTAIDAKRSEHGLSSPYPWTGTIASGAAPIRAVHITEMRTAISEVYTCSGHASAPNFTDNPLNPGVTPIRAAHIQELRTFVDNAPPHTTCTCGNWVNRACGGGSCSWDQRRQTRDCDPDGCLWESQCVDDSSCLICPCNSASISANPNPATEGQNITFSWGSSCGGMPDPLTCDVKRDGTSKGWSPSCVTAGAQDSPPAGTYNYTFHCPRAASSAQASVSVRVNPVGCSCTGWQNLGCRSGCGPCRQREIRTCTPDLCQAESQCVGDDSCDPLRGERLCPGGDPNDEACIRTCWCEDGRMRCDRGACRPDCRILR